MNTNTNSKGGFLEVRRLVGQMRTLITLGRYMVIERMLEANNEQKWWSPEVEGKAVWESELAIIASQIDVVLSKSEYDGNVSEDIIGEFERGKPWRLGTMLKIHPARKILRGKLIPIQEVPLKYEVSLRLFAFLTIQGDKDMLARDVVSGNIHYHYVLAKGQRTTTMLCWDTRWVPNKTQKDSEIQIRPLFHELHGEGRYRKDARPQRWGEPKRKSIYKACFPDLQQWNIQEFRCASNNADGVWPINTRVTRQPSPIMSKQIKK